MRTQSTTALRPGWLLVPLFCILATVALADTGKYAGNEACGDCHADQAGALSQTPHGKAGFAALSEHGCESCHGPASAHVENSDNEALRPRINRDEVSKACQECHDGGEQSHWEGSAHQTRDVTCIDCHSVHSFTSETGQLREPTSMETCFQCHKEIRAEVNKQSHHPIREGKMACGDCHNAHGSTTDKLLRAESVNDQCYECHTEKRGPFLWEHAPVRENCMNCHNAHGSNHQKLQRTANPYLCQQCHSNTRHPGTLYDANTLPGAAKASNREFNRGCVNCHANIHGSNHPSGPYLGR